MTAKVGDIYEFIYPDEPQFNCVLKVLQVHGTGPEALVKFDDDTHANQRGLINVSTISKLKQGGLFSK